jgi:hypothetical protein
MRFLVILALAGCQTWQTHATVTQPCVGAAATTCRATVTLPNRQCASLYASRGDAIVECQERSRTSYWPIPVVLAAAAVTWLLVYTLGSLGPTD